MSVISRQKNVKNLLVYIFSPIDFHSEFSLQIFGLLLELLTLLLGRPHLLLEDVQDVGALHVGRHDCSRQAQTGNHKYKRERELTGNFNSAFFRISGSSDGSRTTCLNSSQSTRRAHSLRSAPKRECVNDESWVPRQVPSRISLQQHSLLMNNKNFNKTKTFENQIPPVKLLQM